MNTRKDPSDNRMPYTLSPAYDRAKCGSCSCASRYLQEFCDRCKDCHHRSLFRERCNAYEGALTY